MPNDRNSNSKPESLEPRTYRFANNCKELVKSLPKPITNIEYAKQLVRASGSVAANYIEANEALSKKDLVMRCRICRKEVKESRMWLRLVDVATPQLIGRKQLIEEASELLKIFSAIISKATH